MCTENNQKERTIKTNTLRKRNRIHNIEEKTILGERIRLNNNVLMCKHTDKLDKERTLI